MLRAYLICYDICEAKRLRAVDKILKGFGERWQYSVFFCVLSNARRAQVQLQLEDAINKQEDRLLIIDLGRDEDAVRATTVAIGQSVDQPLRGARIF